MSPGYFGRYLRIDPRPGRTGVFRSGCGSARVPGRRRAGGLDPGARNRAGVDPLGPEAALVFALSPLVGSPLTTSAKFAVVAFSPLTGRLCDALVVVALRDRRQARRGRRHRGTRRVRRAHGRLRRRHRIGRAAGRWRPAGALWGLSARDAEDAIRAEHGSDWQVAAIGPAGERLIPFATLSHDGRHAGRGGLGRCWGREANQGGRGPGRPPHPARPTRRGPWRWPSITLGLSFGPATEKYRELGTVANLLVFNRFDPCRPAISSRDAFRRGERLAAEDLAPAPDRPGVVRRRARSAASTFTPSAGGKSGVRLEYESLFALGPMCGSMIRKRCWRRRGRATTRGSTRSATGATIAFLMQCVRARAGSTAGSSLRAGRSAVRRRGGRAGSDRRAHRGARALGELLALGSRRAAERIGGDAPALAPHVKGWSCRAMIRVHSTRWRSGLAVGTAGRRPQPLGGLRSRLLGPRRPPPGRCRTRRRSAIETEDRAAVLDSPDPLQVPPRCLHRFYEEAAEMLAAVTGWPITATELHTVARRVVTARKCLNEREGWTRNEDTLPARLLDSHEARPESPALSRERLDIMIAAYYDERGWDDLGRVPSRERRELGLDEPAFGRGDATHHGERREMCVPT